MSGGSEFVRGHNLEGVRRRNLSAVLRLAHSSGPVARSSLTQATGLNRSTIGALVGELEQLGLVVESVRGPDGRVGRPSPVVAANPQVVAIAVNPEIDAVTVGIVGLGGVVHRRVRLEVDHVPAAAEAAAIVGTVLDELRRELDVFDRVVGIGVAVPGLIRESDGLVRLAPHLEWVDEPFVTMLTEVTGLPARAANDARLGANAERLFGAGRDAENLVYVNGGASGIGAGVIVDGTPLSGASGYAGEFGHTLVNSDGVRCHCGAFGCLETEVSQSALRRVLGIPRGESAGLEPLLLADERPEVADEVDRQLGFLATALRNATNLFNPERIVLGGFLGPLAEASGRRLTDLVAGQALGASVESLEIVRAELGENLLMVGAAELMFEQLIAAPASTPVAEAG